MRLEVRRVSPGEKKVFRRCTTVINNMKNVHIPVDTSDQLVDVHLSVCPVSPTNLPFSQELSTYEQCYSCHNGEINVREVSPTGAIPYGSHTFSHS